MDLGLNDKIAIVTGAGSQIGFGRTIAITLAKEGCNVIAADIIIEGAEKTAQEIISLGRQALAVQADVTNTLSVNEMVEKTISKYLF